MSPQRRGHTRMMAGLLTLTVPLVSACAPSSSNIVDDPVSPRAAGSMVDYGEAAERAATSLTREAPEVVVTPAAPSPGPESLVWVGQLVYVTDATPWSSSVTTTTVDGVAVTVDAVVERIRWQTGDGHEMTCTTPHAYGARNWQHRTWWGGSSLGCGHTYTTSSRKTGGTYLVTAVAEWSATWRTSTGHTGHLELSPTTGMAAVRVADETAYEAWRSTGAIDTARGAAAGGITSMTKNKDAAGGGRDA